ncbi:hypothetical protein NLG97_g7633 [Lecanicillium saksenae]|uniref:Uncharacterized protein n=1 Tax=Lecanicillium saksenae TaxID=468837 RepID=A0ACC1QL85_9HYPO|nr:hypothetical protein NLG97_g7633 [Lecanicillium saksenae]
MLLEIDRDIEPWYSAAAGCCSWLLLAVFLMSPATYATIQQSSYLDKVGVAGTAAAHVMRSIPLICIALVTSVVAAAGMSWLSWRWRHNYLWLYRAVVIPTMIHAVTGLGSALLNVYRMQHGMWSVASKITVGVAAAWLVVTIPCFAITVNRVLIMLEKQHICASGNLVLINTSHNGTPHNGTPQWHLFFAECTIY